MKTKLIPAALALLAFLALNSQLSTGLAQGTAFTYQGRLTDGVNPANGSYDLRFIAYDNSVGGSQQGPILTNTATAVSNGLFTVALDFGNQFPGGGRWLEIAVRTNGGGGFSTMSPRQALTPAPYAITAGNVVSNGLAAGTYGSAMTFNNANNSFTGNFSGNGANVTNVNAASLGGLSAANFWKTAGNSGTVPGANFLGTADNQPLVIRANNLPVMQYAYASNSASGYSPNVIGGNSANSVSGGVVGATIGGGGVSGFLGANSVSADFGTVVGGSGCSASGKYAIAGGSLSSATGQKSVAFGGFSAATADYAVAMGSSTASGTNSTAFGASVATNSYATAMGLSTAGGGAATSMGYYSTATGNSSTAMGAYTTASGLVSVAMGWTTTASGAYSLAMGYGAFASGDTSVAMGSYSAATNYAATALGTSLAGGQLSTALGNSAALGYYSTAMEYSRATGDYSLAAGYRAFADQQGSFIWCDSLNQDGHSQGTNTFTVRASGGYYLFSSGGNTGVYLAAGGGSWASLSDRTAKENLVPVNSREVLDKVASLPVATWNYKSQDKSVRHLGPMAQDFAAAFHIGEDDRHITSVDEEGVALAAIQGLNQKLEQKETEVGELKARLAKLEILVQQLAQARK